MQLDDDTVDALQVASSRMYMCDHCRYLHIETRNAADEVTAIWLLNGPELDTLVKHIAEFRPKVTEAVGVVQ